MCHYLLGHKTSVTNQHAYRDNHSIETALIHLINQLLAKLLNVTIFRTELLIGYVHIYLVELQLSILIVLIPIQ